MDDLTAHTCESYASPEDADYCAGAPTSWSERFRAWLCAAHLRAYTARAEYVTQQRAIGGPIKVTW